MPAPQFILDYTGNKYPESKHTENVNIQYSKYETIVEPFGGSFGFSRYVFYKLGHTHLNFIIYDSNKGLIDFYNYLKNLIIKDEHAAFFEEYDKEVKKLHDVCVYNGTLLINKKLTKYMETYTHADPFIVWIMKHNHIAKPNTIRRAVYKKNAGFTEMFKKCTFIYGKCEDIPESVLYDKKTLVYLDPPYLVTDNSQYDTQFNMNTVFSKIEDILTRGNSLMIHQYNFLLCRTFKDVNTYTYKKTYGSGKRVDHIIFFRLECV